MDYYQEALRKIQEIQKKAHDPKSLETLSHRGHEIASEFYESVSFDKEQVCNVYNTSQN